jgi:hypothetical protein
MTPMANEFPSMVRKLTCTGIYAYRFCRTYWNRYSVAHITGKAHSLLSSETARMLAAAGEGAILASQAEPHRECSMAVSGDSVA